MTETTDCDPEKHPQRPHPQGPDTFPLTPAEQALICKFNSDPEKYNHDWLISQLKSLLGIAAQVELATIPIYLYTYYSINRQPQAFKSPMDPPKSWNPPPPTPKPAFPKIPVPPVYPTPYIPKDVSPERAERIQVYANQAGAAIMSVAVEEMLHMSLASNMLYALGGYPALYGKSPWPYPTNLPGHDYLFRPYSDDPGSDWYMWAKPMKLDLNRLSYNQLWQFLEIEWPEDPGDLPESQDFETIGQVYSYIRCLASADLVTNDDFKNGAVSRQVQPGYYSANNVDTIYAKRPFDKNAPAPTSDKPDDPGYHPKSAAHAASYEDAPDSHAGAVELLTIDSKRKALQAMATICDQGEGANPHHINATDDPSKLEDSHYYKFVSIQAQLQKPDNYEEMPPLKGPKPPPVYEPISKDDLKYFIFPYPKNPTSETYASDPVKLKILDACNGLYQYMLLLTEAIFKAEGPAQKGLFYKGMHNSMIWILDKLLQAMRTVPVDQGEPALAPTFENISLGNDPLARLKKLARDAADAIDASGGDYSDVKYYMGLIYDPPAAKPALPDVTDSATWPIKVG